MKNTLPRVGAVLAIALGMAVSGCQTTYDQYGRPVQTVDPGLAVAGIAAAGLIGYAIADDRGGHHGGHHRGHRGYGYGY